MATARPSIYLDHAATTPLLPEACAAVADALVQWANPSSQHAAGRRARAALEDARRRIATALNWDGQVIFTSGATEALAIGWQQTRGTFKYCSAVEHAAVWRHAGGAVIGVDGDGLVDPASIAALHPAPDLVAVQQVNNETGAIQPLAEIGAAVRARGALFMADCAQSAGKMPLPDADLIAIAGHKSGGPPGIGALLVRDPAMLSAIGGQERGVRPGTENLPYALAFAAALEVQVDPARGWLDRAGGLRAELERELVALGVEVIAAGAPRLPTIGAYRLPGMPAQVMLIRCDAAGIAISAGSACSSGSVKPSPVILAMGMNEVQAREVFRISIGRDTTAAELDAAVAVVRAARR